MDIQTVIMVQIADRAWTLEALHCACLLARLRVALRHAIQAIQGSDEPLFTVGDLHVDLAHRQVMVGEKEVHLTPIEYQLLLMLIQYAGKVVTGRQLLHDVWGPEYVNESHYLRIYMGQLRHKLESDPTRRAISSRNPV